MSFEKKSENLKIDISIQIIVVGSESCYFNSLKNYLNFKIHISDLKFVI